MSITLRTIRTAPRDAVPPVPPMFPPVPRKTADAEPIRLIPIAEPQEPHSFQAQWWREALRWLRNRLIQWREEAVREAWANGYRGGRTVERTEISAHIRAELVRGVYDFRTSADAVREILAYLADDITR